MSSTIENDFKYALQQAFISCAVSLDALKASRAQPSEILEDRPSPADVRSDFMFILALLYARSTSLTLVLKAGNASLAAAREPLMEIARDVARLAHCAGAFSVSGATIRLEAIWATEEVIQSIQTYLIGFTRTSVAGISEDSQTLMLRVGTIHSVIDRVRGSFSTDNHAAVSKRWRSDASHLDDGVREVKDMIEEAESDEPNEKEDFDDGWAEIMDGPGGKLAPNEVEASKKVLIVLRMITLLHKRILSRLIIPSDGAEAPKIDLEALLTLSTALAAASDDVAESLWSPQDNQQVASRTKAVQKCVHTLRDPLVSSGLLQPSSEGQSSGGDSVYHSSNKDAEWFKMCFDQIDKAVSNVTLNS